MAIHGAIAIGNHNKHDATAYSLVHSPFRRLQTNRFIWKYVKRFVESKWKRTKFWTEKKSRRRRRIEEKVSSTTGTTENCKDEWRCAAIKAVHSPPRRHTPNRIYMKLGNDKILRNEIMAKNLYICFLVSCLALMLILRCCNNIWMVNFIESTKRFEAKIMAHWIGHF